MKTFTRFLLLLMALAFINLAAPCHGETAEDMLSACRRITQAKDAAGEANFGYDFDKGACWGAFMTLHSLFLARDVNGSSPLLHVCLPPDADETRLITIFVNYTEKHPELYNEDFAEVAVNSIVRVFPCK
ncbi:MAG TPA: Rap1a/Tai family immunity protein [Terracidiphilus sp.]|nr:Rap1a/Tai family immunity protein [Terracidiphilus sp.]